MRLMRIAQCSGLIWLLLSCASVHAAPLYSVTDLGQFWVRGLNNSGQVVGAGVTANNQGTYAYLYNSYGLEAGTVKNIGDTFSSAAAINDSGQIIGQKNDNPIMWSTSGSMISLGGGPGSWNGTVTAINNSGQMAGWGWQDPSVAGSPYTATLWSNGQRINLGALPGASFSQATALNDLGQVAGWSYAAQEYQNNPIHHAALWSNGQITDLGTMGGIASEANGINNAGQIVGFATFASGISHAFLYQDGFMTDLGKLLMPSANSSATAINASGEVIGNYYDPTTKQAGGFLYDQGKFLKLDDALPPGSGWQNLAPIAINDLGQIVATASDPSGVRKNLLLTPTGLPTPAALITPDPVVPEPSTLIGFGAALAMLGLRHAARRN
jgi:probable HAF family extracellular repeat protein